MDYIRVSAKTVSDAIIEAAIQLETSSDNIEYEVLENGSSGFLGFGSKPAVIQAKKKEVVDEMELIAKAMAEEEKEKELQKKREIQNQNEKRKETVKKEQPIAKEVKTKEPKIPVNKEEAEQAAITFLMDVFKSMNMSVEVKASVLDDSLNVDISGDEMGVLIGKRGQTLDSLQYLTSLVVNKGKNTYLRVKLDTENYRKRRKETLENLARNIAFKVRKTRRPVFLEPMNPYERRIIHSALQNDHYVTTHSEGEEPYRKVVVTLRKQG